MISTGSCFPIMSATTPIFRKRSAALVEKAADQLGDVTFIPDDHRIRRSHHTPNIWKYRSLQEVVAVSTALPDYAPKTDVAIELGGEDAKIIYFDRRHATSE